MNRHCFLIAATTLMIALGCATQSELRTHREIGVDNATVDAVFEPWDKPGSPGCALAVTRNGTLVYSRGYGYANLDYDILVTPQTVFDVASITKQFVAASLSMLELEGKLSLEDNVRQWLPELPEYERPILLLHLIYHTSGLRDYLNLFPLAGRNDYHPISHPQILAMMSRQRAPIFPSGERYLYSNTGYMLLAQVVERASGKSLGEFTQGRIFEPLKMTGSLMYDNSEEIIPRRATGYLRDSNGQVRMVHNYNFDVPGDGQLYSTVEDLLRWDNYLHGDQKPAIYSSMLTEGTLNNGELIGRAKGLFLDTYRGLRTVHHTGSSWGSRSVLIRYVKPGLAIAIACNDGNSEPRLLALQVADHYLADLLDSTNDEAAAAPAQPSEVKAPEPHGLTDVDLAEYAGMFFSPELDATYRFSVVDGRLVVRIEQEPPIDVSPVAKDHFEFDFHPQGWSGPESVRLDFTRSDSNSVTGFRLSSGWDRGIVFKKTNDPGL